MNNDKLPPAPPLTNDGADLEFLTSSPQGAYEIPVDVQITPPQLHLAFMRAIAMGWIQLVNIEPATHRMPNGRPHHTIVRQFRLTLAGQARIGQLRGSAAL